MEFEKEKTQDLQIDLCIYQNCIWRHKYFLIEFPGTFQLLLYLFLYGECLLHCSESKYKQENVQLNSMEWNGKEQILRKKSQHSFDQCHTTILVVIGRQQQQQQRN